MVILPGGKIISPIINYFPGGKETVGFIYKRFSRLHVEVRVALTKHNAELSNSSGNPIPTGS